MIPEELKNTFGAQLYVDFNYANSRIGRLYIDQDPKPPETLFGVVSLKADIGYLPRELKPQGMVHWGEMDYELDENDLTTQWRIMDDPQYTGTFYSYTENTLGEDPESGILSFTLPNGNQRSVNVEIRPDRKNILMSETVGDQGCMYHLTPRMHSVD